MVSKAGAVQLFKFFLNLLLHEPDSMPKTEDEVVLVLKDYLNNFEDPLS